MSLGLDIPVSAGPQDGTQRPGSFTFSRFLSTSHRGVQGPRTVIATAGRPTAAGTARQRKQDLRAISRDEEREVVAAAGSSGSPEEDALSPGPEERAG